MKSNFKLIRRFALVLCLTVMCSKGIGALQAVRPVFEIMKEMKFHYGGVEQKIEAGALDGELNSSLAGLEQLFAELKDAYRPFYGRSREEWEKYCAEQSALTAEIRSAAQTQNLETAREAFKRLEAAQKQSHKKFRPGFLKKIFGIFSSKKQKA